MFIHIRLPGCMDVLPFQRAWEEGQQLPVVVAQGKGMDSCRLSALCDVTNVWHSIVVSTAANPSASLAPFLAKGLNLMRTAKW